MKDIIKNRKSKIKNCIVFCLLLFVSCTVEEPTFEYKAIPRTETGAKLIAGTDLIAQIHADSTYRLTPGATVTEIAYLSTIGRAIKLFVFEVDLSNPNVSIEVSTPNNNPNVFAMQEMTGQALAADNRTDGSKVWGGVNADFFNTSNGTPRSIVFRNGVAVKTSFDAPGDGSTERTYFAINHDRKALIAGRSDFDELRPTLFEAVGGNHWLLRNGVALVQTDVTVEPRTWIGVSEDGLKVWIMAVDGRNFWHSNGMMFSEMAQFMRAMGAYNSINLDGGGSTTFFVRNTPDFTEGRFEIRNWPSDRGGEERPVANGLLIIGK